MNGIPPLRIRIIQPDQIYFRWYSLLSSRLPKTFRRYALGTALLCAVCCFVLLIALHIRFFNGRACADSIDQSESSIKDDLVEIRICGWWTELSRDIQKLLEEASKGLKPNIEEISRRIIERTHTESSDLWTDSVISYVVGMLKGGIEGKDQELMIQKLRTDLDSIGGVFRFSEHRGLLLLEDTVRQKYNITTLQSHIWVNGTCLSDEYGIYPIILDFFGGYKPIVIASLRYLYGNRGFLHSIEAGELYSLGYYASKDNDPIGFKIDIIMSVILVYFTTVYLVHKVMETAPARTISFLSRLRQATITGLPRRNVLMSEIPQLAFDIIVFVGVSEFLTFFVEDESLAMKFLMWVWIGQFMRMIICRTRITMRFLPLFSALSTSAFLFYYFLFPFGFCDLAMLCFVSLDVAIHVYFFDFIEVPAFRSGAVSALVPRGAPLSTEESERMAIPERPQAHTD